MRHILNGALAVIILFAFNPLQAQERWSLEMRTGIASAVKALGDTDLSNGFGFEGTIAYRFMPHLSAYAGWGWNQFSANRSFAGADVDFEETGYTFGLQFIHPVGQSNLNYLVRAGGLFKHIETENKKGGIVDDSGHGLGWQIETGLVIPISSKVQLMPSLCYRSLSREIGIASVNTPVDLNYLSTGIGVSWSF
jgi:hypothetical protein